MFEIYLSNAALKALKNLDKRIAEKTKKALLTLKISPLPIKEYDIKKVEGTDDIYRLRISRYRIFIRLIGAGRRSTSLKLTKRMRKHIACSGFLF
jgi:mRNA interferase RelE/StbE